MTSLYLTTSQNQCLISSRCSFWDHLYIFYLLWGIFFLHLLLHIQVYFKRMGDSIRSMRWRRYYMYWLSMNRFYKFHNSLLFRDFLFEFNFSSTISILDKLIFQEYSLSTHNHIVILWEVKVPKDSLRYLIKWVFIDLTSNLSVCYCLIWVGYSQILRWPRLSLLPCHIHMVWQEQT